MLSYYDHPTTLSDWSVRSFSIKLDKLVPATLHYYRGFAANGDYSKIYYGGTVTFATLP